MNFLLSIIAQDGVEGKEAITTKIDTLTSVVVLISVIGLFLIIRLIVLQRRKKRGS